ncbi:DUF6446 family protein [Sinisalibacter lacisalsi]|uniref:Histidine kinase n=1 Tax=Sinisalibacter lacisalsi TaxID=1526570 RepID=A0ABQ1QX14_9RHOB|nr:DUF6446 family protein [Sinisalibacter lacisalsi]GGD47186.1 hypothetical protein GCM10011358_33720 [Sinisalibacter lacisalsi]
MSGKIVGSFVVLTALIAGVAIYWLQLYAFYDEVSADDAAITLVNVATGQPEPIVISGFEGIDATSSPLRYRACFETGQSLATLTETYAAYPEAAPLTGPGWFGCYDAVTIGEALERGEALAFLGQRNISDGVDLVVAVFPDGRAFAWRQLNEKYQD